MQTSRFMNPAQGKWDEALDHISAVEVPFACFDNVVGLCFMSQISFIVGVKLKQV